MYTTFSYFGGAKDVWILAEGKQRYLFVLNLSGAIVNIVLNLLLIPFCGAVVAALASLLTQIFTNIVMSFVIKALRPNAFLLLKALNPNELLQMIKHYIAR